ncbi:poly-beta-1,6 N-acetyl-D-glucosamine export porin PgaA, partial [Escherichia coli]|nr:poly-beta-1,6 N-acetyl-D-glucosamine export porin PgaA [Escherichia coli]
ENHALLRERVDALTDNRVNTPALLLSQKVALAPAERRRLELNAAAESVRLADVPGRTEKERLQLAQSALNRYDALLSRW